MELNSRCDKPSHIHHTEADLLGSLFRHTTTCNQNMNYIDVVTLTWIERSWFIDEFMNNESIKYSNINVKQYINPIALCYVHGYIKNITYLNSGEKLKKKRSG